MPPDFLSQAISRAASLTNSVLRLPPNNQRGNLRRLHSTADLRNDDATRLERARFQMAMYEGLQIPFIEAHPEESRADFDARPHLRTLNMTRVCIDVLSGLYRRKVDRQVDGDASNAEALSKTLLAPKSHLDGTLLWADRLARLQGTVAVQALWQNGRLDHRVIPAHRLAVIEDPEDHRQPRALLVLSADPIDPQNPQGSASFVDIWTEQEWLRVAKGEVVASETHAYGRIPFAILRDQASSDNFFSEGRGLSLCYDNAVLNARLSDLAQVVAMQGFGVMQVVNPDASADLALSPGRAIAFRASGDMPFGISFAKPDAPIRELLDEIRESIQQLLLAQRIPERAISLSLSNNASGLSIQASHAPLLEDRCERLRLFQTFEQELFATSYAIASAHSPNLKGPAPTLHLNFPEPDLFASKQEQRIDDAWRLAQGMATPWEIMARDDPDAYPTLAAAKRAFLAKQSELQEIPKVQANQDKETSHA